MVCLSRLGEEQLSQVGLDDLPGAVPGEGRDDADVVGHGVVGHAVRDVSANLARCDRLAGGGDDEDRDLFEDEWVGHAEGCGLVDRGVGEQRVLELDRIDLEATSRDHVLLAVEQVDVAFVVDAGDVAGPEPAVDERGSRCRVVAEVAGGDHRPAQLQLARLIGPLQGPGFADRPRIARRERPPDGAGLPPKLVVEEDSGG
ncbi:MAG: hypothetical protein ABI317_03915 [Gaiellales bacterium]